MVLLGFYRAVGRVAVVDLDAHLATGTADILCRTLDPAFLYASIAVTGEGGAPWPHVQQYDSPTFSEGVNYEVPEGMSGRSFRGAL